MQLIRYGVAAIVCILGTTTAVRSQARYGVHPSVADTTGAIFNGAPPTPMFNWADGLWNNGEGFAPNPNDPQGRVYDTGGYFGIDDGSDLTLDDVVDADPLNLTWVPHTDPNVLRYVGYLRPLDAPNAAQLTDGFKAQTGFEIFVPATWADQGGPDARPVVILILTWATIGQGKGRNEYVGDPPHGLRLRSDGSVFRQASDYYAAQSNSGDLLGIDVVSAYIVSPIPNTDLSLTVQRTLQLERAVKLLLGDQNTPSRAPLGIPAAQPVEEIPVVIHGGSFGGFTSQVLPIFYPDRFHGGVANAFPASIRRAVGDHEAYTFHTSLCGFGFGSQAYNPLMTLQFANFFRDYPASAPNSYTGLSFYEGSFLTLWEKEDPTAPVQRPIYILVSDEDTVTNGTHSLPLLVPSTSPPGSRNGFSAAGSHTRNGENVYWSWIDRGCHDAYRLRVPAALVGGTDRAEENLQDAVQPLLVRALVEPGIPPPPRPTFANIEDLPGPDDDHDPFDWVIARASVAERREALAASHPGSANALTEDTAFLDAHGAQPAGGIGTWLGHEGAMVVDGTDIWVGSADGIVSRLAKAAGSTRLVVTGQCEFRVGSPPDQLVGLSLGYGVRGLAVTDQHVFVATYRRIYRYDKNDLSNAQLHIDLSWEESRPSGFVVKKLWGGDDLLIYKSFLGELVVRDLDLNLVAQYSEPGIKDFVIKGPTVSGWSRPIYLLSDRGRVVKIRIAWPPDTFPAQVRVDAASATQDSEPLDLTIATDGKIVALYTHVDAQLLPIADTIREFTTDLALVRAYSNVGNEPGSLGSGKSWNAVGRIEPFADGYVVLRGGKLHYVDVSQSWPIGLEPPTTPTALATFPASYYPLGLALADLDGDGDPDVILPTESGQVVWLPHAVVTSGQLSQITDLLPQDRHAHSSGGVVATWGMTTTEPVVSDGMLHVIDQTGRQWAIDAATGSATWTRDVVASKPFRDLGYLGAVPTDLDLAPWVTKEADPNLAGLFYLNIQVPVVAPMTHRFLPGDWPVSGQDWRDRLHNQWILGADAWMPFHYGGHVVESGLEQRRFAYWWSGAPDEGETTANYNNLVFGVDRIEDGQNGQFSWWSSANTTEVQVPDLFSHFRNVIYGDVGYDQQSLRAGFWSSEPPAVRFEPFVVVGTNGGGILIADPTLGPDQCLVFPTPDPNPGFSRYFGDERDEGYGGQALAVADVRGNRPTVFFGTLHSHADDELRDMVSSLHIYDWEPPPSGSLMANDYLFDGAGSTPKLYGLCGLAVGDLLGSPGEPDGVDEELVLTTLNGDLLVYDLDADGDEHVALGDLLYWQIFDGALGACNGIVIHDFDSNGENELYVATTLGVRKFVRANP